MALKTLFGISFENLRDELSRVNSTLVADITTGKRYVIPDNLTSFQRKIYTALKIFHTNAPYALD